MPTSSLAIDRSGIGDGTPALTVHCAAKNVSGHPLNVFDSRRMPYLLDEHGALVVLHGVSPPPEDRELNVIELPTTRVLAPGDVLSFDVPLAPLRLRGHYGDESRRRRATAPPRWCAGRPRCHADRRCRTRAHSIGALLTWQQLESSRLVVVQFP
ncbi:MAG TPA: hypothetical protein VHN14_14060 [Kofleriaceae bacterium]|jgi:hypothetical protein|nr:hypothetical protein [Kofleriaceae bacterium]